MARSQYHNRTVGTLAGPPSQAVANPLFTTRGLIIYALTNGVTHGDQAT